MNRTPGLPRYALFIHVKVLKQLGTLEAVACPGGQEIVRGS